MELTGASMILAQARGEKRKTAGRRSWLLEQVDQLKASIAADEAAMESAQTQLDYTTIVAPSDGRVGIRRIDPGNIVHAADTRAPRSRDLDRSGRSGRACPNFAARRK
jgi:multidrug resistance efflux pump